MNKGHARLRSLFEDRASTGCICRLVLLAFNFFCRIWLSDLKVTNSCRGFAWIKTLYEQEEYLQVQDSGQELQVWCEFKAYSICSYIGRPTATTGICHRSEIRKAWTPNRTLQLLSDRLWCVLVSIEEFLSSEHIVEERAKILDPFGENKIKIKQAGVDSDHKSDGIQLSAFPKCCSVFLWCFEWWRKLVEASFYESGN